MTKLLAYGLDEGELDMLRGTGLEFELFEAGCYQDVLAHRADLAIIDPEALEGDEAMILANFYRDVDAAGENVIVAGEAPAFEGIPLVKVEPRFFDEGFDRAIAIMREVKESRKRGDFSRRIANAIYIMRLIEESPGISTRELAERTEYSAKTVKRYIRSLQAAFVLVDFDGHGWTIQMDPRESV